MAKQKDLMKEFEETTFLDAGSSSYVEQLYHAYLQNPTQIPPEWRHYFEKLPVVDGAGSENDHAAIQEEFKRLARSPKAKIGIKNQDKQIQVQALIEAYRLLGHLQANIDPLNMREKLPVPELMLSYYHLTDQDLDTEFNTHGLPGNQIKPLRQILKELKKIYCHTVASEFMHIPDFTERFWIQEHVETLFSQDNLSKDRKKHIFECIVAAEGLEKYLGAKYPGAKRFSLEGTDTQIVALDTLIQQGGNQGAKEIIICMAHRGRLNVLVNILGKMPSQLFDEFEGKHDVKLESGDVKYHQGFSSNVATSGGNVHLALAFNPSHLEIVTPVICGSVKARQESNKDVRREMIFPIAIHGDAAFAGQGVVMETLNMSETRGFNIGGTIHIITNNQIGFTTSDPRDARSTLYCSDIGKMIEIPIFHVNADDPEAVYRVATLAIHYRTQFKKDVIIDLMGYRRQGHNEADEPAVTQPVMYKIIRKLPTVCKRYAEQLIQEGVLTQKEVDATIEKYRQSLEDRQGVVARNLVNNVDRTLLKEWQSYFSNDWRMYTTTSVDKAIVQKLSQKMEVLPKDFELHPRVKKIMEERHKMSEGLIPIDWGYAEIMAYATLLTEGNFVRFSGQDASRGTFFHRHAVLSNQKNGERYCPLKHLSPDQAVYQIIDSLLSEEAVLAFEYGYAFTEPKGLVIWEAQFGDFANNAQVVIDQFISSGEQKWGKLCGLTLFLPQGYEGQGPEHSSARLERFLQLCAQNNMQVCVPSTPAQVFHMLRRQVLRKMRKPLIVITPKSLLRHKLAVSSLGDLEKGSFKPIITEIDLLEASSVRRVVLCSGKVYYDLLEKRREQTKQDVAIIRIEQLYPFPETELRLIFEEYPAKDVVWCQEEPENQGAWYCSQHHMRKCLLEGQTLRYIGRPPSAAPAVGYYHLHEEQQKALVSEALS